MFLANENFPRPSILLLRKEGFVVESIQENHQGASDEFVLRYAIDNKLTILTFDRDYGELVFRYAQENPPPVVYFRNKGISPISVGELLLKIIHEKSIEITNAFTVVEEKNIRQRFYTK